MHVLMSSTLRIVPTIPGRFFHRLYSIPSNHDATIEALSKPSWSVRSLLPHKSHATTSSENTEITPEKLQHLLRLAALPPPSSTEEESDLVKTLLDQLHFVRDAQSVDTSGVEPLRIIQDEISVREYNVEDIVPGNKNPIGEQGSVKWDVLSLAGRKLGSYLVVDEAPDIEGKTSGNGSKNNM